MKNKIIISILLLISFFVTTGCTKESNKVNTIVSCYHDFTLFHSNQHIENKIYLDSNNKLIDYEYIEMYSAFDSDNEYNMICDGSKEEAINNNKLYEYLNQSSKCETDKVTITNKYDMSKVTSKNNLEGKHIKNYLDDNYILDLDNYKETITSKGYTCRED